MLLVWSFDHKLETLVTSDDHGGDDGDDSGEDDDDADHPASLR